MKFLFQMRSRYQPLRIRSILWKIGLCGCCLSGKVCPVLDLEMSKPSEPLESFLVGYAFLSFAGFGPEAYLTKPATGE